MDRYYMYWNYDTNYVVSLLGYGSGQWDCYERGRK